MITLRETQDLRQEAVIYLKQARIVLTEAEQEAIEVADFGLGRPREVGFQLVVYVNTERCCAKELVLLPHQLCPEHRHPPFGDYQGKEETFRCRWGRLYLYVPGSPTATPRAGPPADIARYLTVWHEISLSPGHQATVPPNTPHWFQAGGRGAVVSEFSTTSYDEQDIFTDPRVNRITRLAD